MSWTLNTTQDSSGCQITPSHMISISFPHHWLTVEDKRLYLKHYYWYISKMQLGAKGEGQKKTIKCKTQHAAPSWVSPEIPVCANNLHSLSSKQSHRTPFLPYSARAPRLGYLVTSDPKRLWKWYVDCHARQVICSASEVICVARGEVQYVTSQEKQLRKQ